MMRTCARGVFIGQVFVFVFESYTAIVRNRTCRVFFLLYLYLHIRCFRTIPVCVCVWSCHCGENLTRRAAKTQQVSEDLKSSGFFSTRTWLWILIRLVGLVLLRNTTMAAGMANNNNKAIELNWIDSNLNRNWAINHRKEAPARHGGHSTSTVSADIRPVTYHRARYSSV